MTVSSETNKSGPYSCNGSTVSFPFNFRILDATHIEVIKTIDGVDTTVSPTAYSVTGVGNANGGTVVFSTAPLSDCTVTIIRNVPFTQQLDLENQGAFYAQTIEDALDLAVMRDQQIAGELDRAVKVPAGLGMQIPSDFLPAVIHFSEIWLGSSASDPTVGINGAALSGGEMYFNAATKEYRVFDGSTWQFHSGLTQVETFFFTATSGQTTFSGTDAAGATVSLVSGALMVSVNGVGPLREGTDFSVRSEGDGIVLTTGRAVGDKVQITSFRNLQFSQINDITGGAVSRAEDAAARAEVAASALGASECTFHLRDYISAEQMVHVLAGDIAAQNADAVTSGLQAMHDAAMTWITGGEDRVAVLRHVGFCAINDELFSEDFAEKLFNLPYGVARFIFDPDGFAGFKVSGWKQRARIRRSGAYKVGSPMGAVSDGTTNPIINVAAGQSNSVAAFTATNGTFIITDLVKCWDAEAGAFATADIQHVSYKVSFDLDAGTYKSFGGGRNNLGIAFCNRLADETGRQTYLIQNGYGGLSIDNWVGSGVASQLYRALKHDVEAALAEAGRTTIDYFLWQHGEANAADATYASKVQTLIAQLKAESWWSAETVFIAGEPNYGSTDSTYDDLLPKVRAIETDGDDHTRVASSYGLPYLEEDRQLHFTGEGLWTLGYGRYFQALGQDAELPGCGDPVPSAIFRWEQVTGIATGPTLSRLRIFGTAKDDTGSLDPIGVKTKCANKLLSDQIEVRDLSNIGIMYEGMVNSRETLRTIEGCGHQPTNAGGSGAISTTVRFSVVGTAITASEDVFIPAHSGRIFLLAGAGPNGHVHRSYITYVDARHATFSTAASIDVMDKCGSFGVLTCATTAGSQIITLTNMPTEIDLVGQYVAVLFAGSGEAQNIDNLVSRVIGQQSSTLVLADAARWSVSPAPLIVAPAVFMGQTMDIGLNGGRTSAVGNDIQIYGDRNENPDYSGRLSAVNLFANSLLNVAMIGGKIHGQSPNYNNFGSNFAIAVLDNCTGTVIDTMQLKWGKYSGDYGSMIVTGAETEVRLTGVQIGNNFAANNARHLYLSPRSGVSGWNVAIDGEDQSGNGWPNVNQGLVRYGAFGSSENLVASGALTLTGQLPGRNIDEPPMTVRSLRAIGGVSIGEASADYNAVAAYRGLDAFLQRLTSVGYFIGKKVAGTTTYPIYVTWGAPGSSLVVGDTYVQVRKPRMTSIPVYANNAAAIAGGLVAGDVYMVSSTDPRQLAIVV